MGEDTGTCLPCQVFQGSESCKFCFKFATKPAVFSLLLKKMLTFDIKMSNHAVNVSSIQMHKMLDSTTALVPSIPSA
jgi:hypothetical protein